MDKIRDDKEWYQCMTVDELHALKQVSQTAILSASCLHCVQEGLAEKNHLLQFLIHSSASCLFENAL